MLGGGGSRSPTGRGTLDGGHVLTHCLLRSVGDLIWYNGEGLPTCNVQWRPCGLSLLLL